jgi:hypothetical protein
LNLPAQRELPESYNELLPGWTLISLTPVHHVGAGKLHEKRMLMAKLDYHIAGDEHVMVEITVTNREQLRDAIPLMLAMSQVHWPGFRLKAYAGTIEAWRKVTPSRS